MTKIIFVHVMVMGIEITWVKHQFDTKVIFR